MPEHSPSPTPERAINGFVLYLGAYIGLGVYLVWAYVPDSWLNAVGLTYLPQKYWALAAPAWLGVAGVFAITLYASYNFTMTLPLNSVNTITDKNARPVVTEHLPQGAVPPIGDLDISEVNRVLYAS